ncbi:GNAT superfamily N-acetyltransferase [Crossiella equi]|uniref:GNAT superfamily N-acetyltransferase n=1 Tax=Crossiella equi TaxID=130796 RepID=A0ABS5A4Y8_9PSEU|nr:GNAT family N-acetyltransferase [Crossiella equi]MBP2471648.1 GNAT superfamily N-acetyltransferase [Crossiella equi]
MSEVVRAWVWGWSLCRDSASPVAEPDGFRIDVAKPGHRVRYVLPGADSVRERAAALSAPGTWLKVCAPREQVLPRLTEPWLAVEPEYLMSLHLPGTPAPAAPAGYSVSLEPTRGYHELVVRAPDGGLAAHGRFAVHERTATVDQVWTDPAHRRRGLGRVVMGGLADRALGLGAAKAVLVSTVVGRQLYESLSWRVESEVTAAHLPEPH